MFCGMRPKEFQQWTPTHKAGLVLDSKSLYDALTRSACSTALAVEKRLAIDYSIARASLRECNVSPFWINNLRMAADALTKLKGSKDLLFKLMDRTLFHVQPCTESGRKERQQRSRA